MSLTIARNDLARLLSNTVRVVESRNTIPILAMVKLVAAKGKLVVTATDLDIEITSSAANDGKLSVCVAATTLDSIVKKLPASAEVNLATDGDNLIVKAGRSRFVLQTLPVADFPAFTAKGFTASFSADLAALFAPVKFAISTEDTRYYLNGIFVHVDEDSLVAVATDGHRLSRNRTILPLGADACPSVIIPRKTVGLVPDGEVTVEVSDTKIRFTAGETVITSKLIDGTFPDYKRVIPTGNDKHIRFDSPAMKQASERVSVVSAERGRAVKFSFAADVATLAVNAAGDSASEEIAVKYDGDPIDIGFNSAYVAELIATLPAGEIILSLDSGGSPALFTSEKAPELLCVLMPMRA